MPYQCAGIAGDKILLATVATSVGLGNCGAATLAGFNGGKIADMEKTYSNTAYYKGGLKGQIPATAVTRSDNVIVAMFESALNTYNYDFFVASDRFPCSAEYGPGILGGMIQELEEIHAKGPYEPWIGTGVNGEVLEMFFTIPPCAMNRTHPTADPNDMRVGGIVCSAKRWPKKQYDALDKSNRAFYPWQLKKTDIDAGDTLQEVIPTLKMPGYGAFVAYQAYPVYQQEAR